MRLLRQQSVFVGRRRRRERSLQRHGIRGRHAAMDEVSLLGRDSLKGRDRLPEILGQKLLRGVAQPVGDTEGAELGEISVVENQDEMTRLFAEAGERVCMTAREIPDIAGIEVVDLGAAGRIDDRGADAPLEDKSPFRRRRVPVQLARDARLKPHRHAGDSLRDRQLLDGRFLAEAAAVDLAGRFLEREFEGRQFLARQERIGNVVLERKVDDVAGQRHGCWPPACSQQRRKDRLRAKLSATAKR